jgi:hypothetical protein
MSRCARRLANKSKNGNVAPDGRILRHLLF